MKIFMIDTGFWTAHVWGIGYRVGCPKSRIDHKYLRPVLRIYEQGNKGMEDARRHATKGTCGK
jgi:hypothetical protein